MRYFVTLSYDGAAYHGWQIQPNANSVQETLQNAFSTILRQDIEIVGAGRTDTGVNASMMIAHFDVTTPFYLRTSPSSTSVQSFQMLMLASLLCHVPTTTTLLSSSLPSHDIMPIATRFLSISNS